MTSSIFFPNKINSDCSIFTRLLKTHPFSPLEISVFLRSFFKPSSFNDLNTLLNLWFLSPLELVSSTVLTDSYILNICHK